MARFGALADRLGQRANRISFARLALFFAGAVFITVWVREARADWLVAGLLAVLGFIVAVALHARALKHQHRAELRQQVHERHVQRLEGKWQTLPSDGAHLLTGGHAYAHDIDVFGAGSLFQRVDTTHTRRGEALLATWLAQDAPSDVIQARQAAVAGLATDVDFRREFEVAALASGQERLDAGRFDEVLALPHLMERSLALRVSSVVLPLFTLGLLGGGQLGWWAAPWWLLPAILQWIILRRTREHVTAVLDGMDVRARSIEAISEMLALVEQARFENPLLKQLQTRLSHGDSRPSQDLRRLRRWLGWAELRRQPLVHLVVNPLVLWDLQVLRGLETWLKDVGPHATTWFDVLAELEALAALSNLCEEPHTAFPEIAAAGERFAAEGLAHPLLRHDARVTNDVALPAPDGALIVTGSNMAGKSTLLRAVGLNITLALAGGPVCAQRMRVPRVRLRASMRVDDSLQAGASYFHAELTKLRMVIDDAEAQPPIFFLLDELLRGTNAQARHKGAWAILVHLLDRGGMGLVATHDTALARMAEVYPNRVENVHFTDTMVDGQMAFDYRLRPGVVLGSNALQLLAMAGIQVPSDADVG